MVANLFEVSFLECCTGLSFSSTMEETQDHKSTIYQMEYVGGRGLNMEKIVSSAATPSADSAPLVFSLDGKLEDGDEDSRTDFLVTGLWRFRSQDKKLWQILPTGGAQLVAKETYVMRIFCDQIIRKMSLCSDTSCKLRHIFLRENSDMHSIFRIGSNPQRF